MKSTDRHPTESGPVAFDASRHPCLKCRVCKQPLAEGDSIYFVGRDYLGAQYVRHATCARSAPKKRNYGILRGDPVARKERIIRKGDSMS